MRRLKSAGLAALFACALAVSPAEAADSTSAFIRCDGNPAKISAGELLGRVVLLTATMGIAGAPPHKDLSQRANGIDGVQACDAALMEERDPIRKVQLMLARSIHHIESKQYGLAVEDARTAPTLAGALADDYGFRHSLLLSSLDLQAAALVRDGKFAEAEAAALKLADAAPYDVTAQTSVRRYTHLTGTLSPETQAYLDRVVKIFPDALVTRALAYQWVGRYLDAANDYASIIDVRAAFAQPGSGASPPPDAMAMRAVMLAMGGKLDEAATVADDTRAVIRALSSTGKAGLMQASIDSAEAALDFENVVADLAAGRASAARVKFAARSRWTSPPAPAVAALAAQLRQGAKPEELTGLLATDPATLRADAIAASAGAITEASGADAALYNLIRPPLTMEIYRDWSGDVWDTKSSVFLHQKTAKENYVGELLVMPFGRPRLFSGPRTITVAAGDALLMHAALLAQSRNQKSFELFPSRKEFQATFVKLGNPGEPGMVAAVSYDAATVISDLSGEFPEPRARGVGDAAKAAQADAQR
ncbi:MAG TPA: hypothetical protein VN723_01160 [Rhizomicrobium sp.]|jgi:hypothetical protein|nr:hypothetical protein [Rhizomicrobium sp.]